MKRPRRRRESRLVNALYLNAGLLLAILVAFLARGSGIGSTAQAAPQMAPIAGGGGIFLMPAQFAVNAWGYYLLDIDSQTVCAYEYLPGEKMLRFVAARSYKEDRKLNDWNTSPSIRDIAHLVELQRAGVRAAQPPADAPPDSGDKPELVPQTNPTQP